MEKPAAASASAPSPATTPAKFVSDEGLRAFASLEPVIDGLSDVQHANSPGAFLADLRMAPAAPKKR
jgi:hypothetical protein